MSHWIILPIVMPALVAALIVLVARHQPVLQRVFSIAATAALLAVALGLLASSAGGRIEVYDLGDWPAPFGIVLVLDRLAALMVALTAALALAVVLYATGSGWDMRGRHFHALFQFQLMGISGAFLTGDIFNLFVFFEILLIASYGLMIHGGGTRRLRAGVQYVVYNLLGSTLFLFALGTIYAVSGTLNMADLALRVAELPPGNTALIRVAAVMLLIVFGVKAALLPLHFWLPETYSSAPGPVAALFAIMTKVGAYAILRVFTLIFAPGVAATAGIGGWVLPAAALTLILGSIGILGADRLGRQAAFASIASMGTLLIAVGLYTPAATLAALYYLVHSVLAAAILFLTVDLVRARRAGTALRPAPALAQNGLVAALFFTAAIAMAGLPPLSGFLGKLMVLDAVRTSGLPAAQVWAVWAVVLATSLMALVGFARAGSVVFWNTSPAPGPAAPAAALPFVAVFGLVAGLAALTVFAGPVSGYLSATAAQIHSPAAYVAAVLDGGAR